MEVGELSTGWDSVEVGNLSTGLDSTKVEDFLSELVDGWGSKEARDLLMGWGIKEAGIYQCDGTLRRWHGRTIIKKVAGLNIGTNSGYLLKAESLILISDDMFTLYLVINGRHETKEDNI